MLYLPLFERTIMNRNILLTTFMTSVLLSPAILLPLSVTLALADSIETEPKYIGVAKYYDNRTCVVTFTLDDFPFNTSAWENCLSMLTEKKIYHTVAIITNSSSKEDWVFIQNWVDKGYTEAGSHSRNHVNAPYAGIDPTNGKPRISYEWQSTEAKTTS